MVMAMQLPANSANPAPQAYPRRVLLAVTGLSPQIVTETLYALAVVQRPAFVPTEVHVITTAVGAQRLRLALLSSEPGWFARLCADHGLPAILFGAAQIHVLCDAAGAPLAALDPLVRRAGRSPAVVPALTDGGRQLALLPTGGKPLASVVSGLIAGLRPRSAVLVGVEEQPPVVRRRHGAGRVATVNAEGLWRWSLGADGDGEVAARFWRQLIKSLAREGQAGLQADRPRYRAGQEAVLTAAGDEVLVLSAPDGRQTSLPRGDGSVRVTLAVAGRWTVTQGARRLTLPVEADVREVTDVARRDERLARLAGATGGVVVEADAAASLADRLARRADLRVAAPRNIPLITSPWWLLLFTGLLAVEWWLRRRRHGAI